ncbi:uncharacterized protein [Antedon mediterranea]|uniref:uncharacterized protein n=1 Tax=Antedon mediterranea TaxID=105859 RepID=UPI003AF73B1E
MNIPFKHRPPNLPDNRQMVDRRLYLLELVPEEDLCRADGCVWYLPHHPVFNPKKPDKCRIVFDCAARANGTSLNDQVHQGPDLTNKLIGVLLRFRQEAVAFTADIQGMFHQVVVNPADRNALRFLWWKNDDPYNVPLEYRMTVHLFGGVWSPSCANYAVHRTVEDNASEYSNAARQTILSVTFT